MPAVFTFSEAGGHPHNEDSFGGRPHPDDERVIVCATDRHLEDARLPGSGEFQDDFTLILLQDNG